MSSFSGQDRPPDALFAIPRLAGIYDVVDGARSDLTSYVELTVELGASSVLDIGCGTGHLACMLADRGLAVTGVDPARASIEVARRRPGARAVHFVVGFPPAALPIEVDLVTMTGNVAQVFLTDEAWSAVLGVARRALREGGHIVFETRDPTRRAWESWTPEMSAKHLPLPGGGTVEVRTEVTDLQLPLVSFRTSYSFSEDGAILTSDSTLCFRQRDEIESSLEAAGLELEEVRDAPDRPGLEFVFLARRPE